MKCTVALLATLALPSLAAPSADAPKRPAAEAKPARPNIIALFTR